MKSFLARWNDIGFVPFKEKERIQKEWNEAMENHFADIRSLESEKKFSKFRRMVTEFRTSGKDRALRSEREKLLQKYRKTEQEIDTLENNIGFFAKSKNADTLVAEVRKKIEQQKEELLRIEEKIMVNDKKGNRTSQWFWALVNDIGLCEYDDDRWDLDLIDNTVKEWMSDDNPMSLWRQAMKVINSFEGS